MSTTQDQTQAGLVIVTPLAAREITRIIQEQELDPSKVRLRVGVKGGGCSGFSYLLDLTETQKETDEAFEQHGITDHRGPQEPAVPQRHHRGLQGRDHGPRLCLLRTPTPPSSCGCGSSFSA
jgi:Fe-S cluster assembly iron-binding protein IscA